MTSQTQPVAPRGFDPMPIAAAFMGISLPALSFGSGAFGACFGIACLLALAAPDRRDLAARGMTLLKGPVGFCAALTLAWWTLSAALSMDPGKSFEVIARMLVFIGLAGWLTLALAARPDARRRAETVLLVGACVFMGFAVLGAYLFNDLLWVFAPHSENWIDPLLIFKAFAAAIAISVPVFLWLGWRRGGIWRGIVLLVLMFGGLLLWGRGVEPARASIVGVVGGVGLVGLVLAATLMPARGRAVLAVIVSLSGLAFLAWIIGQLPRPPFVGDVEAMATLPGVDSHRQIIWGFVLDKIGYAPFLGHGINTINLTEGASALVPGLNQQFVPAHPHNWILEIASETGVPGFILFATTLVLILVGLASTMVGARGERRAAGLAVIGVLGVFWTASLGNFSIWSTWWQGALLAALVLPLATLLDRGPRA